MVGEWQESSKLVFLDFLWKARAGGIVESLLGFLSLCLLKQAAGAPLLFQAKQLGAKV